MKKFLTKTKPYLFISPAIILLCIFAILPILYMIYLSFTDWDLASPQKIFVGFANYVELFQSKEFYIVLTNTFIYMITTVSIGIILALFLAIFLHQDTRINRFFQGLVFMPYVVSLASISLLWVWLMNRDIGLFNYILSFFGIEKIDWLGSKNIALFSLVLLSVWKSLGYNTLIIVAALQSIPKHLFEAAKLDNAKYFTTLRKIILPMISPTLFFITIVNVIASFKVFETINIMTKGGPQDATNTLVYSIYEYAFVFYRVGYASTIGVILMIIIAVLTFIYFRTLSKKVHYR